MIIGRCELKRRLSTDVWFRLTGSTVAFLPQFIVWLPLQRHGSLDFRAVPRSHPPVRGLSDWPKNRASTATAGIISTELRETIADGSKTTQPAVNVPSPLLSPVHTSNNVEATFDFVERTKFQRKSGKTRSTLLPFFGNKVERCFDIAAGVERALVLQFDSLVDCPSSDTETAREEDELCWSGDWQ